MYISRSIAKNTQDLTNVPLVSTLFISICHAQSRGDINARSARARVREGGGGIHLDNESKGQAARSFNSEAGPSLLQP